MTIKRAILIGTLSAITITLIAIGIKTGSFKHKNTTPLHKSTLKVDAEDVIYPVSTKWILNKNLTSNNYFNNTTINFSHYGSTQNKSQKYTNGTSLAYKYVSQPNTYADTLYMNNSIGNELYQVLSRANKSKLFHNNAGRIIEFETEPTGDLYTFLNSQGKPAYNNDIIIYTGTPTYGWDSTTNENKWTENYDNNGITEIRKNNVHIEEENLKNGQFINTSGTIQLFIDAGCQTLKINGTSYSSNLDSAINITNDNIIIETTGTKSGNTAHVFTINYFNTRDPINPQPYPDPSDTRVEYLDITGLMFQILTMPFTFITQAFNLTIFEGTPYQFNFSNFILSLIAIATILFIIKLFTSGFSVMGNFTSTRAETRLKNSQTKLNKAKTEKVKSETKPKKE